MYLVCLGGLFACKPSDVPIEEKKISASEPIEKNSLNEECRTIEKKFKDLNGVRSVDDLLKLNELIKYCLPRVSSEQRYQWLDLAPKAYEDYFDTLPASLLYILQQRASQSSDVSSSEVQQEAIRSDQKYFIENMKKMYIDDYHLGEGEFTITLHPQYFIDVFRPYLNREDQLYFDRIRQEYIGVSPDSEGGIFDSFNQVVDYLLFWEKFKQDYPKSHFKKEIEQKISDYRLTLFRGNYALGSPFEENLNSEDSANIQTAFEKATYSSEPVTKALAFLAINTLSEQNKERKEKQIKQLEEVLNKL